MFVCNLHLLCKQFNKQRHPPRDSFEVKIKNCSFVAINSIMFYIKLTRWILLNVTDSIVGWNTLICNLRLFDPNIVHKFIHINLYYIFQDTFVTLFVFIQNKYYIIQLFIVKIITIKTYFFTHPIQPRLEEKKLLKLFGIK